MTPTAPEPALLEQAADWAMLFQYGAPSEADRQAFEQWRRQSLAHDAAWERAQAVLRTFGQVPGDVGKAAVRQLERRIGRRRSLGTLGLLALAPAGWLAWQQLPWREWTADVATATGERRPLTLPDGSRLVLNTASAVDIAFDATTRRVRLVAGEILVTTHADPSPLPRPFIVEAAGSTVQALGTRFGVRRLDRARTRVAVFEHAVRVHTPHGTGLLRAGEQAEIGPAGLAPPTDVAPSAALWEQGMLLAQGMRLGDALAELARYRPGVLRCDPAVAHLRLSGALSLADTDATLALLASELPVRIERRTRYWVTVGAR